MVNMEATMQEHAALVTAISQIVASFHARHISFKIYHGSTNSTRKQNFQRDAIVDTSPLSHILAIDTSRRTALVEPNVRMDQLLDATLAHKLVPAVVPEFPAITVGGGFAGSAGESSSFKQGLWDSVVNWCEIVLGDGRLVRASKEENADLFEGSKGAMGTLGVVTLFEIQLEYTEGYVELDFSPVCSSQEMMEKLREFAEWPGAYDYLDGIMVSKDSGVVMVGKMTSMKTSRVEAGGGVPEVSFGGARDDWFYLHCQKVLRKMQRGNARDGSTELVGIRDYLFRWERGGFWTGKYAFELFHVPFNSWTRTILNPFMKTERCYRALHHSNYIQKALVQDVAVPSYELAGFLDWIDKEFGIYPLWLCPIASKNGAIFQGGRATDSDPLAVNVGIWMIDTERYSRDAGFKRLVEDNRKLEAKVSQLGGCKTLYAETYYTEQEFGRNYDMQRYDLLRQKYQANGLPNVYSKVKPREGLEPTHAVRGILKMVLGKNHLLPKATRRKTQPVATDERKPQQLNDSSSESLRRGQV